MNNLKPDILYEDNHIIIVNKFTSDLVQKDQTGDLSLDDKLKKYLKEKYDKPGNVFLGIPHRLDRPVSGAVIYAKTSKALTRLTAMFKNREVEKIYYAIVKSIPPKDEDKLIHHLVRNTKQNKSYAFNSFRKNSKVAILNYKVIAGDGKYYLLEINLMTGRHHQIRCQLAKIECPIKGDKKYGYPKANEDKGICLHAGKVEFLHPVSGEHIKIMAPAPQNSSWLRFNQIIEFRD